MAKKYCYDYPHPSVTTDIVVFTVKDNYLQTLLIRRGGDPFKGAWAIPGGFVQERENIYDCAVRELAEETGATDIKLKQLSAYGASDRDPREHVITIVYFALIKSTSVKIEHGSDAADAQWHKMEDLPQLAFDHNEIINDAILELQMGLYDKNKHNVFDLLPDEFTIPEIQTCYEAILQNKLDRRNFSKKIRDCFPIKETGELRRDGPHRPSKLYSLD